jgi:hypothetical protein
MWIENTNFSWCESLSWYHLEEKPLIPKFLSNENTRKKYRIWTSNYSYRVSNNQEEWFFENQENFSWILKESLDESIQFLKNIVEWDAFNVRLEKYLNLTDCSMSVDLAIDLIGTSLSRSVNIYLLPENGSLWQYAWHLSDKEIYYGFNPHKDFSRDELLSIIIHEFTHAIDDWEITPRYALWIKELIWNHYEAEVYANLNVIRFELAQWGIDILNKPVNEEQIQKVLVKESSTTFLQATLESGITIKQLVILLNTLP